MPERTIPRRLDTLPADVRRYLLPFLDLEQLSALVHACPVYHAQYWLDRQSLLIGSVEHTAADAFTIRLFQSRKAEFEQDVPGFLRSYPRARHELSLQGRLDLDAAVGMAHFYFNVVKPLAEKYACWALRNLAKEIGHPDAVFIHDFKLTSAESMRLTRAIYRFQLLCEIVTPQDATLNSQRETNAQALLDTLDPWEVEEIVAFFEFAKDRYAKLVDEVRWDFHPDNPKFEDQERPPTPEGAVDLDDELFTGWYCEGLTLRGLDLLHTALCGVRDHDHLVELIRDNIVSSNIPIDVEEGVLGDIHQETRYKDSPTMRDELQQARTPMPFQGDGKSDTPPQGWTVLWRQTYSNLYGYYIPADVRRWGFVFWDASTLESTGGLELLERQMEDFYDPRDDLD